MKRLEELAEDIAADVVEGPELAELLMGERDALGHLSETEWRDYQRVKVACTATGVQAALQVLACGGAGPPSLDELERLTHRLAVGWARMERRRGAEFDADLRDLAAGGEAGP